MSKRLARRSRLSRAASMLILASVLASARLSVAEAQDRAYERGEALAWYISAYVPCEAGMDATSRLKSELDAFSASRDETVIALQLVADDEETCGAVRSLSGELLQVAETRPERFAERLGLAFEIADAEVAAAPSTGSKVDDRTAFARVRAEDETNAPPKRPQR
jgi:hypothetical protein